NARYLDLRRHGRPIGHARLAPHLDQVRAVLPLHQGALHLPLEIADLATVRERLGAGVDDAHDERPRRGRAQLAATQPEDGVAHAGVEASARGATTTPSARATSSQASSSRSTC